MVAPSSKLSDLEKQQKAFTKCLPYLKHHGLPEGLKKLNRSLGSDAGKEGSAASYASASSFKVAHLKALHWDFITSLRALTTEPKDEKAEEVDVKHRTRSVTQAALPQPELHDPEALYKAVNEFVVRFKNIGERPYFCIPKAWLDVNSNAFPSTFNAFQKSCLVHEMKFLYADGLLEINDIEAGEVDSTDEEKTNIQRKDSEREELSDSEEAEHNDPDRGDIDAEAGLDSNDEPGDSDDEGGDSDDEAEDSDGEVDESSLPNMDLNLGLFRFSLADFRGPFWTLHELIGSPMFTEPPTGEMSVERYIAAGIQGFCQIEDVTCKANQPLKNALIFLAGASQPKPDISTIVNSNILQNLKSEKEYYTFIICAAEAKTSVNQDTPIQLAAAFHPTLMMMVIMHLQKHQEAVAVHSAHSDSKSKSTPRMEEKRKALVEKTSLPAWYFLIGLTFDHNGVKFYAHMPAWDKETRRWKFTSMLLDERFKNVISNNSHEQRCRLARQLFLVQRHTALVRDELTRFFKEAADCKKRVFPEVFQNIGEYSAEIA